MLKTFPSMVLICVSIPIAAFSQTGSTRTDEQTLIKIEHLLNDADARHDAELASKYLDDDYIVKSVENGLLYDKSATLEGLRREAMKHKDDPEPTLDEIKAVITSDKKARVTFKYIAVVDNEKLTCQVVDTFVKRADGWKLRTRTGPCHH